MPNLLLSGLHQLVLFLLYHSHSSRQPRLLKPLCLHPYVALALPFSLPTSQIFQPPARAPVVQNRPITPPPSPPRPAETAQDVLRYLERKSGNGLHLNVFELESLTNTLEAAARSGSSPAKARRAADYLKTKGPELNLNAVEFDGFKNILREAAAARVQGAILFSALRRLSI